jgi:Putative protein-S-isoprenylcysteine methyltransferase
MTHSLIAFGGMSLVILAASWHTIFHVRSHGFYRFFGWECMAWLLAINYSYWFADPLSITQLISWALLFISIYPVTAGLWLFRKKGKAGKIRVDEPLYSFERTSELIQTGIYKYIRHPMYCSLILLNWGLFFKHPTIALLPVALAASLFLFLTAVMDEKECIAYFGEQYREYMKHTKRFVPFIL